MKPTRRAACQMTGLGILQGLGGLSKGALRRQAAIGFTGINWNVYPGDQGSSNIESALRDISLLGFSGFETFPENLEDLDAQGRLRPLMQKFKVPLTSGYIRMNLTDPQMRKQSVDQAIRLAKLVKRYGGKFIVLAPQSVDRQRYDYPSQTCN